MSDDKYYDIHTSALAYLNRIRQVKPDGGDPYYAVTLACLNGKADADGKIDKLYVDTTVRGDKAIGRIARLLESLEALGTTKESARILANVYFGDLKRKPFVYQKGERKGETGWSLKAHLLNVKGVSVNGEAFCFDDEDDASAAESDSEIIDSGQAAAPQGDSASQQAPAHQDWEPVCA